LGQSVGTFAVFASPCL